MKRLLLAGICAPVLFSSSCIHIKTDPVDVHMTVDVNVKIDRALDNFFSDLDRKSATIENK